MRRSFIFKALTYSFFLLLLSSPLFANQPALPTTLYGKVSDRDNGAIAGMDVKVRWIDSDGKIHEETTSTLNKEEASSFGDPSFEGYYFFNKGTLQAAQSTYIDIFIDEILFESIPSNPGSALEAKGIILSSGSLSSHSSSSPSSSGSFSGSTSSSSSSSSSSPSSSASSTSTPNSGISFSSQSSPSSSFPGSLSPSPSSSSLSNQQDLGTADSTPSLASQSVPQSEQNSPSSSPQPDSNQNVPQTESKESNQEEGSEKDISGQLLDANGEPLGGVEITAEWIDEKGDTQQKKTQTITKEEAEALGNASLEGSFSLKINTTSLQGSDLSLKIEKANSSLTLKTLSSTMDETLNGEHLVLIDPLDALLRNQTPEIYNYSTNESQKEPTFLIFPRAFPLFLSFLILMLLLFLLSSFFFFRKSQKKKQRNAPIPLHLHKDASSLYFDEVNSIMSSPVITIDERENSRILLARMIDNEVNSIIVVKKEMPIGIITEFDVLSYYNSHKDLFPHATSRDIMNATYLTIGPKEKIHACVEKMRTFGARKLLVMKGKNLLGIITVTDILLQFSEFFSKTQIESSTPLPTIRGSMSKHYGRIRSSGSIPDVLHYIIQNSVDHCLVLESQVDEKTKQTREIPSGIITIKDLMDELYKSESGFELLKVTHIAKSPVASLPPFTDLLKANEFLHEKKFRRIVVQTNESILGVLTQDRLLFSLYDFISEAFKIKLPNKISAKK